MNHVILFDIDGTLINGGGAGLAALTVALREALGFSRSTDSVKLSGRTDHAILADLLVLAGAEDTLDNRRLLLAAYLAALPGTLRENSGRVLPGVEALLGVLSKADDLAIGLLTGNVREGASAKLAHFGLDRHFRFGGYGGEHADRDDVARAALDEVRRLHPGHGTVWVIGDTPHDIRCARAIGARAVGVLTGWHGREEMRACGPDLLLDDLSAPAVLLREWGVA
ncbi:MAG: haloacid dehalogenase-like hydrolase [Gemmataceae bacterium]|nr:haloacid dehalogenase-like hydrolase [Gemmataceae bacterium]